MTRPALEQLVAHVNMCDGVDVMLTTVKSVRTGELRAGSGGKGGVRDVWQLSVPGGSWRGAGI